MIMRHRKYVSFAILQKMNLSSKDPLKSKISEDLSILCLLRRKLWNNFARLFLLRVIRYYEALFSYASAKTLLRLWAFAKAEKRASPFKTGGSPKVGASTGGDAPFEQYTSQFFECCLSLADSWLEQVVPDRFVKRRKLRRRKGLRTF